MFQYPSNRVVDRSERTVSDYVKDIKFQYPSNRVVDRSPAAMLGVIGADSLFQYPSNRVVDRSMEQSFILAQPTTCFSTLQIGSLIEACGDEPLLRRLLSGFSTLQIGSLIEAQPRTLAGEQRDLFQYPSNRVVDRSQARQVAQVGTLPIQYPSNRVVDRSTP